MKIKLTLSIALSALLTATGCASSSEPSAEIEQLTNQQLEINNLKEQQVDLQEQLQAWEEMKPELDRLVALEGELSLLIQQQKELAKASKLKAREEKRKQREARPFFMLQLASLNNLDKLKNTWLAQQKSHPEILNGLPARYQQIEVKGKQYFRLKAGEFNQKADALKTCEALIAEKVNCIVVNNKGTKL